VLILLVSYDAESLNRGMQDLESAGHPVVPASSLESGLNAMVMDAYRLVIFGASVPFHDRQQLASTSRKIRPEASIVSVEWQDSPTLALADLCVQAGNNRELLDAVKHFMA
jgi:DNA-binding response OmpR family regulator